MARKKQKPEHFREYVGTLPMPAAVDTSSFSKLLNLVLALAILLVLGWSIPRLITPTQTATPAGEIVIPNASPQDAALQVTAPASYWQPTGDSPQVVEQGTSMQNTFRGSSLQGGL